MDDSQKPVKEEPVRDPNAVSLQIKDGKLTATGGNRAARRRTLAKLKNRIKFK